MRLLSLLLLGMLISGLSVFAQTETISDIEYTYDAAGNRVTREIIYYEGGTKSAVVPTEEELESEQGLNVYPNPANHSLYVSVNQEVLDEREKMIMVFDNLGKLIYQTRTLQELNQVDVSNWMEGTYILKLIYGHRHKEWIIVKN